MYLLNGKPFYLDSQFTANDINYPAGWVRTATPEQRLAVGITEVPDPIRPDDRFYFVKLSADGLSYTKTPKDLAELKKQWVAQTKQTAHSRLAPSDWLVLRSVEDGTAIPAPWKKYRSDVRAYSSQRETDINSTQNIDVFIALVSTETWPIDPDEQARRDAETAAA